MKTKSVWWVVGLALALALPVGAGDYKCEADTQTCLNQMAMKYKTRGWVGLEMDENESGALVVTKVIPDSPAVKAGFRAGDTLLAINGLRFADNDKDTMKKAWGGMKPGEKVKYTIGRSDSEVNLDVTLGQVPDEVLASWIGRHMMDHVTVASK